MELKYTWVAVTGIVLGLIIPIIFFVRRGGKEKFKNGQRFAGMDYVAELPEYRRLLVRYRVLNICAVIGISVSIISCGFLLAQPIRTEIVQEEKYSRDILICMDISSSVDDVNKNMIKQLIQTVKDLKNERIGIIMFNTSPVLVSPLTDDYEYTIEKLELLERALRYRTEELDNSNEDEIDMDWLYLNSVLTAGTQVGSEERGSSLIGDGLASCINNFSNRDTERTRVVIFTTDNELYGTPYVTLTQAGELCAKENIVVYGVGTELMRTAERREMQAAVERTGGKFFLEETSGSFKKIVEEIDQMSRNLCEGSTYVSQTVHPLGAFLVLLIGLFITFASFRVLKE